MLYLAVAQCRYLTKKECLDCGPHVIALQGAEPEDKAIDEPGQDAVQLCRYFCRSVIHAREVWVRQGLAVCFFMLELVVSKMEK